MWIRNTWNSAERFEQEFVQQGRSENRSLEQTLSIGWEILSDLPRSELNRIDAKMLDQHYNR